jgi:hypothetical protein
MSGENEQVAFDVNDDVKVENEPEIQVVSDDEPEIEASTASQKPVTDPAAAIQELNRKLQEERQARSQAEQYAREAAFRASQAANEVDDTHQHLVANAIDSVRQNQESLKANLRESMSIGDYDRAAELQETMSMNSAKLIQLEQGLQDMKNRPRVEPVRPVAPPQNRGPDVDALIQQVTPLSAQWLQNNRDHLREPKTFRVMARAHEDAVDHGIIPESNEYFRFVESRLGISDGGQEVSMSSAASPVQRRQSPPAAPVSRQASSSSPRSHVVKLTPAQREAASISGLTEQEYAKYWLKERNKAN